MMVHRIACKMLQDWEFLEQVVWPKDEACAAKQCIEAYPLDAAVYVLRHW